MALQNHYIKKDKFNSKLRTMEKQQSSFSQEVRNQHFHATKLKLLPLGKPEINGVWFNGSTIKVEISGFH